MNSFKKYITWFEHKDWNPWPVVFILILLLFLWNAKNVYAQAPAVNITVNIVPPYSPYYSDYSGPNASKVLLIIQNTTATQLKIKLTGQLQGDNGIKISTKSTYVPLQPIILNPRETKQLNGLALKDIFDLNSLNVYGIDKVKLVQTSRLPEGNYTFCIQAVDMNTNQTISVNAPLGCTSISITYPDAPFLINPMANNTVSALGAVSFVWGTNAVVPTGIAYSLQVAEMPDIRTDPNQVLNATSFLLINKRIFNSMSTVLLPSDPPLKKGKRYAWRVIADDPSGKIIFKNKGISRANEFRYGEAPFVASVFALTSPTNNVRIADLNKLAFKWTFTDNSAKNDAIGFYDGIAQKDNAWQNNGGNKYELKIARVKSADELRAEKRINMGSALSQSKAKVDNGIIVPLGTDGIDYKSSEAIKAYVKDGNNYEWSVKHLSTGTISESRMFTVSYEKSIPNYTVALTGNIRYNFYDTYLSGISKTKKQQADPNSKISLTEAEKGFALANTSIQVLRVNLLTPVYSVSKKVTVKENGINKTYIEKQDSIALVSDLSIYPYGQQSISASTVVASGVTDQMGGFKVDVPISQAQYRVLDSSVLVPGRSTKYALVTGLVIRVNDTRWSDPNWYVFPNSDSKDVLLNEATVELFSYKAKATLTTSAQRDYKGKLYLLRNENNLVKGEAENIIGVKKDILTYKTVTAATGKKVVVSNATTSYAVVGVNEINAKSTSNLSAEFAHLAVAGAKPNDGYTLYFEPDNEQDALYFSPVYVSNGSGKKSTYQTTNFAYRNLVEAVSFGPKFISMQISGRYVYNWKQPNGKENPALPLPEGTSLKLVRGNLVQKDFFKDGTILDGEKIIASTKVKKNGEYTFSIGMTDYNDFNDGQLAHMVILVSSDYYYSMPYAIEYNQNENINLPELKATVRQYSYISKVGYIDADKKLVPVKGMEVYLCRKIGDKAEVDRPINDGDPQHQGYFKKIWENAGNKYEIIDRTTSSGFVGQEGEFTFNRLLAPKSANDTYFIFSEPMSTSQDNFITQDAFELTHFLNFDGIKQGTFTDDQTIIRKDEFNQGFAHVPVVPLSPYIDGAVYPNSNASTSVLSGVHVEMFNMFGVSGDATEEVLAEKLKNMSAQAEDYTKTNGRFLFENVKKGFLDGWKLLRFTKQGFLPTYVKVNGGKKLADGQRGNLGKVFMNLPQELSATVVDATGKKISARIIVGDDFSWADYNYIPGFYLLPAFLTSPYGNVKFTVIPVDRENYKTTVIYKTITKSTNAITFTAQKNQRTILVRCYKEGTNTLLENTVTVTNTSNYTQTQKYFGGHFTELKIDGAGTKFDLRVVPTDQNYTIVKTQVYADGLNDVGVDVYVKPAITLTCTAMQFIAQISLFGQPPKPDLTFKITGFKVYVKNLDEDEYEVPINYVLSSQGIVQIKRLPANMALTVSATKSDFIGETKVLSSGTKSVQFKFTSAPTMNTSSIYGFPMELTKAAKQSNGQYMISGWLTPVDNGIKAKSPKDKLAFTDVLVNVNKAASGQSKDNYFTAVNPILFDQNSIDGVLFGKYTVKVLDNSGLSLQPRSATTASILGKIAIDAASFAKGVETSASDNEGDYNYLYLNEQSTSYAGTFSLANDKKAQRLYSFGTATSELAASEFMVSSSSRGKPTFSSADEITVVPDGKVVMTAAGISFTGNLKTALAHSASPDIDASANYVLDDKGFSSNNEKPFTIRLFQWELKVDTWKYGTTGLNTTGTLNTQGLSIPFSSLQITKNNIGFGVFNVKDIKLLNSFPVTINGSKSSTSFGYDKGYSKDKGAWSVSVVANNSSHLASLKGLPDLADGDEIRIKNINLYDTGNDNDTRLILVDEHPLLTLNDVAKFRPNTVWGTSSFITFRGGLNMEIPGFTGLDAVTYDLTYKVENGQFTHKHEVPFTNIGLDSKGMLVKFAGFEKEQVFSKGQLYLKGMLGDKDPSSKYQILVELVKTKDQTILKIPENTPQTKQKIYLAGGNTGSYLDQATGKSMVKNNQWDYFTFSGDLTGADGIEPSPMSFTIKGDVVANSSKLGVNNMDAGGVSGLSITYDFNEKALMGSGHIKQNTSFASLDLDVEMKISSGNWYIFSNGIADVNNTPFKSIGVGFMVGNSKLSASQKSSFYKHFGGTDLPPNAETTFNEVKGVLMMLSAEMPIPILPTIDLNLDPVAHCEFKHGFYAAAYFKANFTKQLKDLSLTVGGRVGAFVKLGAGASIGLACAGINLGADAHADIVGSLIPFKGQFSATTKLTFNLSGSAYVGAGICNSSCETPCVDLGFTEICSPIPCVKKGLSKSLVLSIEAGVNNSGFYLSNQSLL